MDSRTVQFRAIEWVEDDGARAESPGIAKASVQSQIETVLLRTISALIQGKDPFPAVFPWCPSSLSFRSIRMRGRRGVSSMRRCTWIWKVRPGSHARMGAPVLRARTTLQVLSLIHELSVDGAQTSLRDVYYRDPMLFESQRNSDEVISTFQGSHGAPPRFSKLAVVQAIHLISAKLFRCPRSALGLTCASRGKIFGPVYYTANGQYYDCRTFQAPAPTRLIVRTVRAGR
jgi:hypothetical protein